MNIERLVLLRELSERGTITEVAAVTHRTPSAVSQQLKVFEQEVGVQLVEPFGRGVRLTEAGELVAAGADDVVTSLERIEGILDGFKHEARGTVTISAFPTSGEMLLPGTVARLSAYPGISVECTDRDVLQNEYVSLLLDYHIVLAFSSAGESPWLGRNVIVTPLLTEPIDVALPADHPLATKRRLTARDVIGEPWIGSPEGFPFDSRRALIEAKTVQQARIVQRFSDNRVAEAFVARGLGIAFLPRYTSEPRSGDGGFVLRPLADVPLARNIVALLRRDHADRLVVKKVLQAIVEEAQLLASHPVMRHNPVTTAAQPQ